MNVILDVYVVNVSFNILSTYVYKIKQIIDIRNVVNYMTFMVNSNDYSNYGYEMTVRTQYLKTLRQ